MGRVNLLFLEAIANQAGFGAEGGSKNINFKTSQEKTYAGAEKLVNHLPFLAKKAQIWIFLQSRKFF